MVVDGVQSSRQVRSLAVGTELALNPATTWALTLKDSFSSTHFKLSDKHCADKPPNKPNVVSLDELDITFWWYVEFTFSQIKF